MESSQAAISGVGEALQNPHRIEIIGRKETPIRQTPRRSRRVCFRYSTMIPRWKSSVNILQFKGVFEPGGFVVAPVYGIFDKVSHTFKLDCHT